LLGGLATALPHESIINTPALRDVGIIYTEPNYQGQSNFLLENRKDAGCYPLNKCRTAPILSVKVCMKSCTCVFFTGSDTCGPASQDNFVAVVRGPTDIAEVKTPAGHIFKSYICGENGNGN
ncbi:hypothetical protein DM02DRAFT_481228, partial [Periconia macrospinosa]